MRLFRLWLSIPIHRYNLFHFFDIFIKIFFDAITDHHCFFFIFSFTLTRQSHIFFFHINHLILCWHILLYIYNSSVSFFGLSFIFEQYGGAVYIYQGSGTFTTCSFIDNTATQVSTTIIKTLFSCVSKYIIRRLFFGHLPSSKSSTFFQFFYSLLCLPRATLFE